MPVSNLAVGLTRAAKILVKRIKDNLSAGKYPDDIAKGIEVGSADVNNQGGSIDIKFTAPQSRAFEEGSGEHGPEGEKYEIWPDEAGALAFEWDKMPRGPGPKFIGAVGEGTNPKLLFRFVEHPGIEPRPYIRPAVKEEHKEMKKVIGKEFAAILMSGERKVVIE